MIEKQKKTIEVIDGIPHEVTVFIGDGKQYDANRQDGEPVRQGSRLLRPVVDVEPVVDPAAERTTVTTSDIPVMADDPNQPWSTC